GPALREEDVRLPGFVPLGRDVGREIERRGEGAAPAGWAVTRGWRPAPQPLVEEEALIVRLDVGEREHPRRRSAEDRALGRDPEFDRALHGRVLAPALPAAARVILQGTG